MSVWLDIKDATAVPMGCSVVQSLEHFNTWELVPKRAMFL